MSNNANLQLQLSEAISLMENVITDHTLILNDEGESSTTYSQLMSVRDKIAATFVELPELKRSVQHTETYARFLALDRQLGQLLEERKQQIHLEIMKIQQSKRMRHSYDKSFQGSNAIFYDNMG